MVAVPITPGMTEWAVAQQYGISVSAVEAANNVNPLDLQVGSTLIVPTGGSYTQWEPSQSSSASSGDSDSPGSSGSSAVGGGTASSAPSTPSGPGTSAPSGISIPGMPQGLANCIWFRESTDGQNPAAGGNQFGIIPASGYNVAGDSVAQQEQVAGQIYAQDGGAAWSADGCPGT